MAFEIKEKQANKQEARPIQVNVVVKSDSSGMMRQVLQDLHPDKQKLNVDSWVNRVKPSAAKKKEENGLSNYDYRAPVIF